MKKLIVVAVLLISASGYSLNEKMLEEWKTTTWRLGILLKSKSVHGGAVQFAIMDYDPSDTFKKDYVKIKERSIKEKRYDADSELSIITVAWDIQFRNVKGDEVYLLLKKDTIGFSSNNPEKQYYLVTKTTMVKDNPSVWIISFKAKLGTEQDIILDDRNVIYLKDIVK